MKTLLVKFIYGWRHDCRGATAVEYGLIAAGIAVAITASIFLFGENLVTLFSDSSELVAERP